MPGCLQHFRYVRGDKKTLPMQHAAAPHYFVQQPFQQLQQPYGSFVAPIQREQQPKAIKKYVPIFSRLKNKQSARIVFIDNVLYQNLRSLASLCLLLFGRDTRLSVPISANGNWRRMSTAIRHAALCYIKKLCFKRHSTVGRSCEDENFNQ